MSEQNPSDLSPSTGQLFAGWRAGNTRYRRQSLGRYWMIIGSTAALATGLVGIFWMLLQSI